MKRLGLLVRADRGGLGVQTRDMLAHLSPDRVLVVGMRHLARIAEQDLAHPWITYNSADVHVMNHFLDGIDVMLSVETFYEPYLVIRAGELGIERVLYANPELLNPDDPAERADRYLWACPWEYEPPAGGKVLPWPAPADTIEPHAVRVDERRPLELVHISAPAMLDRDGKNVLLDAMTMMTERARLSIFGVSETGAAWNNERASVEFWPSVEDHRDMYAGADLMVLPRRYGALSLPMFEAAAAGVPTLTTRLSPQRLWFAEYPELLIDPGPAEPYPMKGNRSPGVPVHQPDPSDLARALDHLARTPGLVRALGRGAREWAEQRSWPKMLPTWEDALR